MGVVVYGASDDLIEIEGDIREEFSGDEGYLGFSNGVLLRVDYTNDGVWTVHQIAGDPSLTHLVPNEGADSNLYSDRMGIDGDIQWVVRGLEWAKS